MENSFCWYLLKGRVFHVTSEGSYRNILATGKLLPSQIDRDCNFKQSQFSYARANGYISLFDFATCPNDKIKVMYDNWNRILKKHIPTVLIRIDQNKIADQIIPNSFLGESFAKSEFMSKNYYVPRVKAWYPGQLGIDKIMDAFRIDWNSQTITEISVNET